MSIRENQVTVKGTLLKADVYETVELESGDKYRVLMTLDAGEGDKIRKLRDAALESEFGNKVPKNLQDWTVREGDDEERDTFEMDFIHAKSTRKPKTVRMVNGKAVAIDEVDADEYFYPGAKVACLVDVYAYKGSKSVQPGVTAGFSALCFVANGERLAGGGADADAAFEGIESEEASVEEVEDLYA